MSEEKRFCKKCHCELSDYTKGKLCGNCRKKRDENLKKGAGIAGGIAATAATTIALILNRDNNKGDQ